MLNTPYLIIISLLFITVLYLLWREISKTQFYLDISKRMDAIETSYNTLIKQVGQQTNSMCNELKEEIYNLMNGSSQKPPPTPDLSDEGEVEDVTVDLEEEEKEEDITVDLEEEKEEDVTVDLEEEEDEKEEKEEDEKEEKEEDVEKEEKEDEMDDFHISDAELNNLDDEEVAGFPHLNLSELNLDDGSVEEHDVELTREDLEKMSLPKLKELAQKNGVMSRGKKFEIIQRLIKRV